MTLDATENAPKHALLPVDEEQLAPVVELEILPVPEQRIAENEDLTLSAAVRAIESFGAERIIEGEVFERRFTGCYSYVTTAGMVGITVWGLEEAPTISVYSCARTDLAPTLELYRATSAWRATSALANPYVMERSDGTAAVLCEQTIGGCQLTSAASATRTLATVVDCVTEVAAAMGADLEGHGGRRLDDSFTPAGVAYLELFTWWQIRDPRISRLMGYA